MGGNGFSNGSLANPSTRIRLGSERLSDRVGDSGHGQFVSPRPKGSFLNNPTPGSAEFFSHQANHGFDPKGWMGGPWQMIPKGGSRAVELHHGANHQLDLTGDVAKFKETTSSSSNKRIIWISGLKKGEGTLRVLHRLTERPIATLRIHVLPETTLKIGFYLLRFDRGAKGTKRSCADVDGVMLPRANEIIRLQSNCRLEKSECKTVTTDDDLEVPDPHITADELKKEMRRHKPEYNRADQVRVMLVPHLELSHLADGHGFYVGGSYEFIAVEDVDLRKKAGQVLAHEIGHHLIAHDHTDAKQHPANLMIPGPAQSFGFSVRLTREQILKIHNETS